MPSFQESYPDTVSLFEKICGAFTESEHLQEQRDVTQTFVEYACCLTESLGYERIDPNKARYRIVGRATLDTLLSHPTGFIVATAHVGAWDCAATHLHKQTRRPVLVVMTRETNFAARRFHDSLRQRQGVEIAHVGQNAFEGLALIEHLHKGGVVAMQLDRVLESSRSLQVLLFDQHFEIPRGPFQLASLASVPVVPVFCARIGHFAYEIHVNSPIWVERRARGTKLSAAAQSATHALELFLRRYPTQWFHFGGTNSPPI